MKRVLAFVLMMALLIPCFASASAAFSYDDFYPEYFVSSEVKLGRTGKFGMYIYPVASDLGSSCGEYFNGTILKVINWNADKNYAYVIAPDGTLGYARKTRLVGSGVFDSYNYGGYAQYVVQSEHKLEGKEFGMYMYPLASDLGSSVAQYTNGTVVSVIDWNIDKTYCFAMGPDGNVGYLRKSRLYEIYPAWTWTPDCTPRPTPVPTATPTPRPTATPTPVPTATPTPTPTFFWPTATPTPTFYWPTATPTPTFSWNTPTPTFSWNTPTPTFSWNTPTPTFSWNTPTPRPTATPTVRPTTPAINKLECKLVLSKYNQATGVYTDMETLDVNAAYLTADECYRLRLYVANRSWDNVTYTLTAVLNGTTYTWRNTTLTSGQSVSHVLGARLPLGYSTVAMYIDGTPLISTPVIINWNW